jgi:hypothetical protein
LVAAGAIVARDLHLEDPRPGRGEIGDGPSTDLDRLAEPSTAFRATLQGQLQRWRVGDGALAGAPRVAGLAPGGFRFSMDRPSIEHSARRNVPGFGRSIGGGEHRGAGRVASELLLEAPILLLQFADLLLLMLETFPELLALGRIDRDGLIVLGGSQMEGRAHREQGPLGKGGRTP